MVSGSGSVVEPRRDLRVVRGDPRERIACETAFGRCADRSVGTQFVEHDAVVGGVDDHGDELVVLGCGTHHRRAADVDQLDARIAGERIQVAHHQIDRLDPVLRHVGLVRRLGGVGEQSTVNLGMQGDDTVVENCRHAGELGEVGDGRTGSRNCLGRAAAADHLPAESMQVGGELDDAGLVVHGEQRSGHDSTVRDRGYSAIEAFTRCTVREGLESLSTWRHMWI